MNLRHTWKWGTARPVEVMNTKNHLVDTDGRICQAKGRKRSA